MSSIRTYEDLLEEKKRLEDLLQRQKLVVQEDFTALKEEYKPAMQVLASANKIFSRDLSNPIVRMGMNLAGDLLQKRLLFPQSSRLVQYTLPVLGKNLMMFALSKGIAQLVKIKERYQANRKAAASELNSR